MLARDSDEVLSFGTFPSVNGPFEPHASLAAQANGTLAIKAAGLDLLPGGGDACVGSGKASHSYQSKALCFGFTRIYDIRIDLCPDMQLCDLRQCVVYLSDHIKVSGSTSCTLTRLHLAIRTML